jgi:hypothetical protein
MPLNKDYDFNEAKPPRSPHVAHIAPAVNAPHFDQAKDSAQYLIDPDDDFARPYLAIPGTKRAYIWPLGIEGFELQDQAQLGRHKYLGEIELDVDVLHRAETLITLSGTFPGWTSVENMNALRAIFYANTPERGKILHLPGILPNLQYVVAETETFRHEQDERTMDMTYSFSCVKVGTGKKAPWVGPTQPNQRHVIRTRRGRGAKIFVVTAKVNSLRKIAAKVYGSEKRWGDLYAIDKNSKWFQARNIPTHLVPDYRLPPGLKVSY